MGETTNKSQIAELAFDRIFKVFGWSIVGPRNEEWGCIVKGHKLGNKPTKTHPTDAVYRYYDPYRKTNDPVFVNADFKSYAKSTLETVDLAASIRSMSNTVECANKSPEFKKRYDIQDGEVVGLLFVYNHDNAFDVTEFPTVLGRVNSNALDVARDRCMSIMGPLEIKYLLTIATDIQRLKGEWSRHDPSFVVPHLVDRPAISDSSLSLEILLGPWILLRFTGVHNGKAHSFIHMYYRSGGTVRQFEYIIDYLFRFQLLEGVDSFHLSLPNAGTDAAAYLQHAKERFVARCFNSPEIAQKLQLIKLEQTIGMALYFSTTAVGMRND